MSSANRLDQNGFLLSGQRERHEAWASLMVVKEETEVWRDVLAGIYLRKQDSNFPSGE